MMATGTAARLHHGLTRLGTIVVARTVAAMLVRVAKTVVTETMAPLAERMVVTETAAPVKADGMVPMAVARKLMVVVAGRLL